MIRALALIAGLSVLGSGCADSEPTIAYQYVVRGNGENVAITFFTEDQGLINGEVSLPWASEEFEGTIKSPILLEADGPEGSRVTCVVRHWPTDGRYGGDRSLELSQYASSPDEDQTFSDERGLASRLRHFVLVPSCPAGTRCRYSTAGVPNLMRHSCRLPLPQQILDAVLRHLLNEHGVHLDLLSQNGLRLTLEES